MPPGLVDSECKLTSRGDCNEIYTPCTIYLTVGIQEHMQHSGGGGLTMDECKLLTVFLIAFDFSTSASLTTTISQTFYCVLGMQVTWGEVGNYISQPFADNV